MPKLSRCFLFVAAFVFPTVLAAAPCVGFTDVDDKSAFCASVAWLKNRGITLGCSGTAYCPTSAVTREQMAAFMNRLGSALAPLILSKNELLVTPIATGTERIVCESADFTASASARSVTVNAVFEGLSPQQTVVETSVVARFSNSNTWSTIGHGSGRGTIGQNQWANIASLGGMDVPVGVTVRFGLRVMASSASITAGRCRLHAVLHNQADKATAVGTPHLACHAGFDDPYPSPPYDPGWPKQFAWIEPWFNAMTITATDQPATVEIEHIRVLANNQEVHRYEYDVVSTASNGRDWLRSTDQANCLGGSWPSKEWSARVEEGRLILDVAPTYQAHGYGGYVNDNGRLPADRTKAYSVEALVRISGPGALQVGMDYWSVAKDGAGKGDEVCTDGDVLDICEAGYSDWLIGPTDWTLVRWR